MAIYKAHESKPLPLHERPNMATPEDLSIELGTIVALVKKTKEIIKKSEDSRLAGKARLDADVIKSARVVQGRLDNLKLVIDRYEQALARKN